MAVDFEVMLAADIGGFTRDPLRFVLYAFPWGQGELADFDGPDNWQRDILGLIGEKLKSGASTDDAFKEAIKIAVASGHGIGKSALVAWIILWAMSTCPDTKGVVTANTENQLRTKTWAELAKWHRLCICGHWFDCTATALISKEPGHEKTWRVDSIAWSERNTEAFAGLHNKGRRVLIVFDEASAIPDVIWEVSEGALTDEDTEIVWCAFGNPTRNTGRFRECFGKFRHRWETRKIDSRTAKMTNKEQIAAWVSDFGEDSDFVKVRVRGEFPSAGTAQFIPAELAQCARGRHLDEQAYKHSAKVMALDVARFGGDSSVLTKRQGLYCAPQRIWRGVDLMALVGAVAQEIRDWKPEAVFIDGVGVGAGVVDRLRELGFSVTDAQAGARAIDAKKYANRRAEMWAGMREWLANGGIPEDQELFDDLTGLEYGFTSSGALLLEKKEDMKKRGLSSPDRADSLALTFYAPVASPQVRREGRARTEYDVLGWR